MVAFLLGYTSKFVSRWFILLMDMVLVIISFSAATIIRFNFDLTQLEFQELLLHLPVVLAIRTVFFIIFSTNRGIIRHTSYEDALLLFKSVTSSSLTLLLLSSLFANSVAGIFNIPRSIILIDYFILLVSLTMIRFGIKTAFEYLVKSTSEAPQPVIIYGAGLLGITTKTLLLQDKKRNVQVLCYIDDNTNLIGKTVEGIKVLSREEAFSQYFSEDESKREIEVIFAIGAINRSKKNEIIESFLDRGINLKIIPPAERWIDGELSTSQIEQVRIEDLLDREPIKLNNGLIKESIRGKRIFITGAAGSIGSEIVRQILPFHPSEITLIDQAESALYDLETELKRIRETELFDIQIHVEVASVSDEAHMNQLFKEHKPQLVFHAAAYKHVPLMENNPYKAFEVNVLGTKTVSDLAYANQVEKFVLISTDKAVNPTNVMGATKRLAEIYVQSLNKLSEHNTRYMVTRFGNVLGSNGSVIPLFKKQIEHGGPVTVTHPEIIRYFMTIPEACQLVLEAGVMGKGGEVFVFDMGEPVKVADLAKKMIQLSGFEPNKDIEIQYTGLREGEKLYEELLGDGENETATYHPKIKIAKLEVQEYKRLNEEIEMLRSNLDQSSHVDIVSFLKKEIPEYISNNSIYELLDESETDRMLRNEDLEESTELNRGRPSPLF